MSHLRTLSLGLALAALATTSTRADEARRLADWELKLVGRAAEELRLPAEKKAGLEAVIEAYSKTRKAALADLAADLKAIEEAHAAGGGDAAALLGALDEDRVSLRSMHLAKMDELGSFFTDTQKLRIAARLHRRHKDRPKAGKVRGFVRKHLPTLFTKVLGIEPAAVEAATQTFESRKAVREGLKQEWKALAGKIGDHLAQDRPDEETSRLLVIQAKQLRERVQVAMDDGLEAFRSKLTPAQRLDMVAKLSWGVRKLAGFVGNFVDIEELKLFQ